MAKGAGEYPLNGNSVPVTYNDDGENMVYSI